MKSTDSKCCGTKDLPKGSIEGDLTDAMGSKNQRGRTWVRPLLVVAGGLLIPLLLVKPVLRSGQVFRPIINVEISSPGAVGLIIIIGGLPGKVSAGFPRPLILLAHSSSHCAW